MPDSPKRASNYIAAREACHYARRFIVKGSTQNINNTYTSKQRIFLEKGIVDLRDMSLSKNPYNLEEDSSIQIFYRVIELCKKFSLGNCFELALLSLEYVLITYPNLRAEVFILSGGDHTFLVIGRNPASLPHLPKTWGRNVFLCDPWTNSVYSAYKYARYLRSHSSTPYPNNTPGDYLNHIEKFEETRHTFKCLDTLTTTYLRIADTPLHKLEIKTRYQQKTTNMLRAIKSLMVDLQTIAESVKEEYGSQDGKYLTIQQAVNKLTALIDQTTMVMKQNVDINEPYLEIRMSLQQSLKVQVAEYWHAMSLSESDKKTLFTYRYPLSPKTLWMRFFNTPPKTVQKVIERLETAQEELKLQLDNV